MRCPRVQYLYDEYVAGTLEHKTAETVDMHLAECAECRDYFQTNDDLAELIFEGNEIVHPGEPYLNHLSERVLNTVMNPTAKDLDHLRLAPVRPINPWHRPLWWTGAVAAVTLVVLGIQRDPQVNLPRELAALNEFERQSAVAASAEAKTAAASQTSHDADFVARGQQDAIEPVSSQPSNLSTASSSTVVSSTSGRAMGQTFSKSVTHPDPQPQDEADSREQALAFLGNSPTPGMTPVRMSRPPSPEATRVPIGPVLIEQIIVMDAIGTEEARERIYELLEAAGRSPGTDMNEILKAGDPELLKQWSIFSQAESAFRENRQEVALKTFILAADMNPDSALGLRAHMRIGDIRYQTLADFEHAQESYARCIVPNATKAFTRQEMTHIERRNNLLGRYAAVDWEPLKSMHVISNAEWSNAASELDRIARSSEASLLIPEAAQIVIARLQSRTLPTPEQSNAMLASISSCAQTMENRASQAWLAMCMGELYLRPLQNPEMALNAYQSVVELDPQSAPADHARQRQYQIRTQALQP